MTFFVGTFIAYVVALLMCLWWFLLFLSGRGWKMWSFPILIVGVAIVAITAYREKDRPDGYGFALFHSKEQVREAKLLYNTKKP
jgi:hypothetical protein